MVSGIEGHARNTESYCATLIIGTVMTLVDPALYEGAIHNHYHVDAIIMFVILPFIHLTTDEETKGVIADQGWYRGSRDMLGIKNQIPPH